MSFSMYTVELTHLIDTVDEQLNFYNGLKIEEKRREKPESIESLDCTISKLNALKDRFQQDVVFILELTNKK
jgi:hypothetical protein